MIDIRRVSFVDILDAPNAADLLAEYEAECAVPEIGPIKPNREIYAMLEKHGLMQCFGAFDGEELIGFINVIPDIIPHYGTKVAKIESNFVLKSKRNTGGTGTKLKAAAKSYGRETGCAGMYSLARVGSKLEAILDVTAIRTHSAFYESLI